MSPTLGESQRVAAARSRAEQRMHRQRSTLRPLGFALIVAVAAGVISGHPAPGVHGKALAVTVSLVVFAAALRLAITAAFADRTELQQAGVIAVAGAAGVALTALQPRSATGLAGGAAVWMAFARLPLVKAVVLGAAVTVGLDLAAALTDTSAAGVFATTLLCMLLALVARFMRQARESQDRTELLMAQLEDAQEQQKRTAAIEERGRIATELHDVLAHSLSGAAIQLQGARKLADREQAASEVRSAIDRASELVKDGLTSARQAVGALRGDALPSVAQLESLVDSYRTDLKIVVDLRIEGVARTLPAEASLALYRGAQEALTNVARYAPGASTTVVLRYDTGRTVLTVDDTLDALPVGAGGEGLTGVGGGRGLEGMRERVERAGGSMCAGPTDDGWRVELEVPG